MECTGTNLLWEEQAQPGVAEENHGGEPKHRSQCRLESVRNWGKKSPGEKHGLVTCFWNAIACHGSIIFHLSSVQILILTSHLFWHNPFSFPSVPFVKTAAEPYLHRKIAAALSDLQCALTFEHLIHLCIQQLPPQAICCVGSGAVCSLPWRRGQRNLSLNGRPTTMRHWWVLAGRTMFLLHLMATATTVRQMKFRA